MDEFKLYPYEKKNTPSKRKVTKNHEFELSIENNKPVLGEEVRNVLLQIEEDDLLQNTQKNL